VEKIPTSLVLGSGGARGLAHIGVIQCLEAHNYDIQYISGSSMGALVGGIYAAGKLDVFTEWVGALQKLDVLRLLDWSLAGGAIFKGDRIIQVLTNLIGDRKIEELPIGFTAIATELSTSREVWLNRGSLFEAIRASTAVPTIFAAVRRDNLLLVDGGVVNPVPVAPTLNNHTDVTIAVDLNGPDSSPQKDPEEAKVSSGDPSYRERILHFLDAMRATPSAQASAQLGFYDLAMRSMETMQRTITQLKLATYAPTLLIQMPRNACGFFDFYRAKELIAEGYERTDRALQRRN
jgi:NTE family protein